MGLWYSSTRSYMCHKIFITNYRIITNGNLCCFCLSYSITSSLSHFIFAVFYSNRNFLVIGQNVPSRSALLCRPLWNLALQQSQGLGRDLKLHQISRHLILNHPKSPFPWNWISWQNCTVPAFLVNNHKRSLLC